MIDYSFVIRTVGTAGSKYQALLDSISQLTIKPREVLVVLPEGYSLPSERLGWERFIFTSKGMVAQRAFCLNEIKTEYALFCDDDWSFEPKFVEKLSEPILKGRADITFPILSDLLPQGTRTRLIMALTGTAVPMLFAKKYYVKILKSGSYSYNPYINKKSKGEFLSESAPGLCFFIKTKNMLKCHFEDEMWLQDTRYPIPEDQVMFYKFHLLGYKIIGLAGLHFKHLDAGSSSEDRDIHIAYALSRNKFIFWHRYIYLPNRSFKRSVAIVAYKWMNFRVNLFEYINYLFVKKNKQIFEAQVKGRADSKEYIKSNNYNKITKIKK